VHGRVPPLGVQLRGRNLLRYQAMAWHQLHRLVRHRRPRLEGEQDVTAFSPNIMLVSHSRIALDNRIFTIDSRCDILGLRRTRSAQTMLSGC
jgi:hypothetical protein